MKFEGIVGCYRPQRYF